MFREVEHLVWIVKKPFRKWEVVTPLERSVPTFLPSSSPQTQAPTELLLELHSKSPFHSEPAVGAFLTVC